ncbi:unnamed protein product [Paramecium pentaurelia]|uniref:Uncharacterized protein n=1 Tax=Paramecium pentaurelia TaxID=43138 RepID=A0A8S1XEN2_9CILI|nr:unnamed protein product [Paramecium pentaurelia]
MAAYSFGTSHQRPPPKVEQAPGVGNYNPDRYPHQKPPAWKIGTASRIGQQIAFQPGPGQYEQLQKAIKRKKPEFSMGAKFQNHTEVGKGITPGPGAYNPDFKPLQKCASSYSMRNKPQLGGIDDNLRELKNGPGPAAYETNYSTILSRPASRIGNQNRGGFYDTKPYIPGVGKYNVRPATSGPYHRFGNALRDSTFTERVQTPGPGQYLHQSHLNLKATTISSKRMPTATDSAPGPGHYDPSTDFTKRSVPGGRVGTAKQRQVFDAHYTPGPGHYQSQSATKRRPPSYKIGSEQRRLINQQEVPGPGTYDISRDGGSKGYTLRPKYTDRLPDGTPGPLDYHPNVSQTKSRPLSCRVGTETREKNKINDNPAPNHYQFNQGNPGPKFPFGSESRVTDRNDVGPGPGTYNIPPYFANVPNYLIPNKSHIDL